jgi:hypothetical protein
MMCFVMWFLCVHAIYCWEDHGSMIGGLRMMDSQIGILSLLKGNLYYSCAINSKTGHGGPTKVTKIK